MSGVFISYRRDDSAGYAGRLYDGLRERFGPARVFMDVAAIEPGSDFEEVIDRAVAQCAVLVTLIGARWVGAVDDRGRRRLDSSSDFVRLEVVAALRRRVTVIPVLVGGAEMPQAEDLPEDLAPLSRRQAVELSDTRWDYDVGRLAQVLESQLQAWDKAAEREGAQGGSGEPPGPVPLAGQGPPGRAARAWPWRRPWALGLGVLLAAAALALLFHALRGERREVAGRGADAPLTAAAPQVPPRTVTGAPPGPMAGAPAAERPLEAAVDTSGQRPLPERPAPGAEPSALPTVPPAAAPPAPRVAESHTGPEAAPVPPTAPIAQVPRLPPEPLSPVSPRRETPVPEARAERHPEHARRAEREPPGIAGTGQETPKARGSAGAAARAPRGTASFDVSACLTSCEERAQRCRAPLTPVGNEACRARETDRCRGVLEACRREGLSLVWGEMSASSECSGRQVACEREIPARCEADTRKASEPCEVQARACGERCQSRLTRSGRDP